MYPWWIVPTATFKNTQRRKKKFTLSESDWTLKIRMYRNSYMFENQVENHSKIYNSINNQKPKTSRYNFYQVLKEKRDTILDIMMQKRLFLLLNVIINRVGTRVSYLSNFWTGY